MVMPTAIHSTDTYWALAVCQAQWNCRCCCSEAKSYLTLWSHGLLHTRIPCPSLSPEVCSDWCPLNGWRYLTISASLFSCLQSFPAAGSFPISWPFVSGGQRIRALASASVLPMNIQDWFPLGWTVGSPCSSRDCCEFSPAPQFKSINSSALSFLHSPTLTSIHDYWKHYSFD